MNCQCLLVWKVQCFFFHLMFRRLQIFVDDFLGWLSLQPLTTFLADFHCSLWRLSWLTFIAAIDDFSWLTFHCSLWRLSWLTFIAAIYDFLGWLSLQTLTSALADFHCSLWRQPWLTFIAAFTSGFRSAWPFTSAFTLRQLMFFENKWVVDFFKQNCGEQTMYSFFFLLYRGQPNTLCHLEYCMRFLFVC